MTQRILLATLLLAVGTACTDSGEPAVSDSAWDTTVEPWGITPTVPFVMMDDTNTEWLVVQTVEDTASTVVFDSRILLTVESATYYRDRYLWRDSPLAKKLLAIPGVTRVGITAYRLRVTKAELFEWDEIIPAVGLAIEAAKDEGVLVE